MGDAVASDNRDHTAEFGGPFNCIGSFARDAAGELYFMDFDVTTNAPGTGRVYRVERAPNLPPTTPVNLSANVQGSNVTISWDAAPTGGTAASYLVEAGTSLGAANVGTFTVAGTTLSAAGVPAGGYYVRVRARNGNGTSAATGDLPVAVGCSFPVAPATFTAAVSGHTVTLGWSVAAGTTQTIVEAGAAPGFVSPLVSAAFAAASTGVAFPGVPSGTYYARVRAVNACGQGGPSIERTVVVP